MIKRKITTITWKPPDQTEPIPWVAPEEFVHVGAISNDIPGFIAPQVLAHVGYKLASLPGVISVTVGTVNPSTVLVLILIVFFFWIRNSPSGKAILQVVHPVVVGLLLWTA